MEKMSGSWRMLFREKGDFLFFMLVQFWSKTVRSFQRCKSIQQTVYSILVVKPCDGESFIYSCLSSGRLSTSLKKPVISVFLMLRNNARTTDKIENIRVSHYSYQDMMQGPLYSIIVLVLVIVSICILITHQNNI